MEVEPVRDRACFENSADLGRGLGIRTSNFRRWKINSQGAGPALKAVGRRKSVGVGTSIFRYDAVARVQARSP